MKVYAHLQLTLLPTDRQKAPSSFNRPVSEVQWKAIRNILHLGEPTDVVALPDLVPSAVGAMLRRLCRERISCDKRTIQEVWHHLKHAIVHPGDVCQECAAVESFGEPHEDGCKLAPAPIDHEEVNH